MTTRDGSGADESVTEVDAVVVGAGFAGIYMLYRLCRSGFSVRLLDDGDEVGGTWFWNRYPGARCDVESIDYSYSFSEELQQEWEWSERYASQPEIFRYLNHVVDRFDLRPHIQLSTRVTSAVFDDERNRWEVTTTAGQRFSSRYCVMTTGCLSVPNIPAVEGLETFGGPWYHTARWPAEDVDFTGQRVGVIGTGSSGIQCTPLIAEQASHLYVFQRTPNFSVPAHNAPLDSEYLAKVKANYATRRHEARWSRVGYPRPIGPINQRSALDVTPGERQREFEAFWGLGGLFFRAAFVDLMTNRTANDTAVDFVHSKIREMVTDADTAQRLMPRDYPFAAKRPCVDTDYYQTFNRDNVTLVDTRESPIQEITPTGLCTDQAEYELDAIVFATGFDAMTGALLNIDIRGKDGLALETKWTQGPRTYLGLAIAGFPNLFIVATVGSPSVLSNMVMAIEQHVDWISDCLEYMRRHGVQRIEATAEAEDAWVQHCNETADATLYPLASSWYKGSNIPGKPQIFMPYVAGLDVYRRKCDDVAARGYEGFDLSSDAVLPR